eukprot:4263767-Amphidinium_carterae.2
MAAGLPIVERVHVVDSLGQDHPHQYNVCISRALRAVLAVVLLLAIFVYANAVYFTALSKDMGPVGQTVVSTTCAQERRQGNNVHALLPASDLELIFNKWEQC